MPKSALVLLVNVLCAGSSRLTARALYDMILLHRTGCYNRVDWTAETRAEFKFLETEFSRIPWPAVFDRAKSRCCCTWADACDVAWGGYTVHCVELVAEGNWPRKVVLAQKSSTWRELKAIELVLESLTCQVVCLEWGHRKDNQATARI